jgi:nitrite reductase (NO-forming)
VNGETYNSVMPKLDLTDEEIANILTYVYGSWGNAGHAVSPEEVKSARSEKSTSPAQQGH